jgi:DNA excision repair protein ERCC-4
MRGVGALGFHKRIIEELHDEDGLAVLGRGLGVHVLLAKLLRVYCAQSRSASLVLFVHCAPNFERLRELARLEGVRPDDLPVLVTYDCAAAERTRLYARGGVLVITSRILVTDFLRDVLDAEVVSGIVVAQAERVTDSSTTGFALRLFRRRNARGFIKALSEDPVALTTGFARVEKLLRSLQVRRLCLWPRFQINIVAELSLSTPDVVELTVAPTRLMLKAQRAIYVAVESTLGELQKVKTLKELGVTLSVAQALGKHFAQQLRRKLSAAQKLQRLRPQAKQFIADLATLGDLMRTLVQSDCVAFLRAVQIAQRTAQANAKENGGRQLSLWLMTDAADALFRAAKRRVFKLHGVKSKSKSRAKANVRKAPPSLECVLETHPKVGSSFLLFIHHFFSFLTYSFVCLCFCRSSSS